MENEIIIRKLEAEIMKLQNKNRMLKNHLQILVSAPCSLSAERIRFVNGVFRNNPIVHLN
ncbi:MAG TPA: hypothetical protein VHO46_06925 [Bacteroidales bacterium]|nr:hypothetical protein [Bacteroidales bacterium]